MSQAAKNVDEEILKLSQRKVDININKYIDEIKSLDSALSEKEHASLKNYTAVNKGVFISGKAVLMWLGLLGATAVTYYLSKGTYILETAGKKDLTLGDYSKMLEEGSITQEEFDEKKKELLGL